MDAPESESLGPGGRSGRWVLFAGVYAVYFAFGVVALSIPPLVGEVRADLGLSRVAMGLALGAWQLVYLGSAPPAGRLVEIARDLRAAGAVRVVIVTERGLE